MKNIFAILFALVAVFTLSINQAMATNLAPTMEIDGGGGGSKIDLKVKYIQKEKVVRVHGGYNVFLKVVVKNEGYYTLKRPFKVGFRFATSATQRPEEELDWKLTIPFLGAKAAVTKHVCLFIPDSRLYGTNILGVQAIADDSKQNWFGDIYEIKENNNRSNTAICYLGGPS